MLVRVKSVVDSSKLQAETNYWQSRITLHGNIRLQSDLQISNTPGKVSHCHIVKLSTKLKQSR